MENDESFIALDDELNEQIVRLEYAQGLAMACGFDFLAMDIGLQRARVQRWRAFLWRALDNSGAASWRRPSET